MVIDLSGIDDVRFILGYHKAVKLLRMQHSSAHHRNFADGLQDSPPLYLWEPRANPQGHTHLPSRCSAASRTYLLRKPGSVAFQGRYRLIMRQPLVRIRFLNAILTNRFLLLKREPSNMRSFLTGQPFCTFFFCKIAYLNKKLLF